MRVCVCVGSLSERVTPPTLHPPHPTHPQNLIERILRLKVYETTYWKQHCFGLTAGTVLDKAVELRSIGGSVGPTRKPSRFVCLTLKLLQIQPVPDVVLEYVKQDAHKYVRLLGAFYWRLTARPADVFRYLEPLLADARRVRMRHPDGTYALSYVDEVVDSLLVGETLFDVALPRLPPRRSLVATGALAPRVSPLATEFEAMQAAEKERAEAEAAEERGKAASVRAGEDGELPSAPLPPPPRRRSRSPGERRRLRSPGERRRSRSPGGRPRSRSPRRRGKVAALPLRPGAWRVRRWWRRPVRPTGSAVAHPQAVAVGVAQAGQGGEGGGRPVDRRDQQVARVVGAATVEVRGVSCFVFCPAVYCFCLVAAPPKPTKQKITPLSSL